MENSDGEVERVLATLKSLPKPIPSRRCAACMFQSVSTSRSASCNVAAIGYFLANVSESPFRACNVKPQMMQEFVLLISF